MRRRAGKSTISALAALMVFALFAACVLCVLLSGAGVYRSLINGGQESYARRTMTQYVATRVQHSPNGACISTEPFGAGEALVISEEIDGEIYLTGSTATTGGSWNCLPGRMETFRLKTVKSCFPREKCPAR